MNEDWDWLKNIPSSDWHRLVLASWPGWMLSSDNEPNFVTLEITNNVDKSSRDIAVEWDDLSKGQFYYRDYTESSLPFVEENELYKSIFCFQYKDDAIEFTKRFNGKLNQKLVKF